MIFDYEKDWGGAIHRGKWTPYAIELCNENGFEIDYNIRGIETGTPPFEYDEFKTNKSGILKIFRRPIKTRLVRYIKYLKEYCTEKIARRKSLK